MPNAHVTTPPLRREITTPWLRNSDHSVSSSTAFRRQCSFSR
jgi:hypothetical protein